MQTKRDVTKIPTEPREEDVQWVLVSLAAGFILGGVVAGFASPWVPVGVGIFCGALAGMLAYIENRSVTVDE